MDDGFDRLPDSLVLLIFNSISDVKTLTRCRLISRRFNSLVPQTDSLFLKIDSVISSDHYDDNSFLSSIFKSIINSFFYLISPMPIQTESPENSPPQILRQFHRIQCLEIEFPSRDLKRDKGSGIQWKAEFGNDLRSCVILVFQAIRDSEQGRRTHRPAPNADHYADEFSGEEGDVNFMGGLKTKVFWIINTLVTASARHYVMKDVVEEHREIEKLILRDSGMEGVVVMDKKGLEQLRKSTAVANGGGDTAEEWSGRRTRVPSSRMKIKHSPKLQLKGGVWMEDATMVVVRPTEDASNDCGTHNIDADVDKDDAELAVTAFEGVYREAVEALLKKGRSYQLETNSF